MAEDRYDLVVIGGGPAGYAAALYGAAAGLSVALVERDKVGGTCLHRGCIPAKEWLETAAVARTVRHAGAHGINASFDGVDFAAARTRKDDIVAGLYAGVSGLLKRRKVNVVAGTGRLADAGTVVVAPNDASGDVPLVAANVLLATGSVPRTLSGLEVDGKVVVTSDEFLDLNECPPRAAVVGGGAIGCEFASTLVDLGSEVTMLELADSLLPGADADIVRTFTRALTGRGIDVRTGVAVSGHKPRRKGGTTLTFAPRDGGGSASDDGHAGDATADAEQLDVDMVVVSVGRRPFADPLGVAKAGVAVDDAGFVTVDERCRTNVDGVYAAGDLIDTPQLAHVGFAEAMVVVRDILGEPSQPVNYANVPWAIYSHPEVAFAGLTEQAAIDAGYDVVCAKHTFAGNARAQIVGAPEGLVKLVAEKNAEGGAGQLLGVHMVGPWVTELLAPGYFAVNWEATADDVAAFITPHPTLTETFGEAVLALTGRGLHS